MSSILLTVEGSVITGGRAQLGVSAVFSLKLSILRPDSCQQPTY